jgi:hypothetical protein
MKRVCALIVLLPLASACTPRHANEHPAANEPSEGVQQMDARMQHMQGLMERIRGTDDAQERQRLMHEHMESMQQSMTMMRRMMREQRGKRTIEQVPPRDTDEPGPDEAERHDEHH